MSLLHLLILAACLASALGRPIGHGADEELSAPLRELQQVAFCPDGCAAGACIQDATKGGLRCQKCVGSLVVNKVTGECACPAGRYSKDGSPTCVDCPKSKYCPGETYRPTAQPPVIPNAYLCPFNMTTIGMRSTSIRACVNIPGFYYTLDSSMNPGQEPCPVNTYGPGLKKQRLCVPCPTGFSTAGKIQQTMPVSCVVPAGYYLKAPGQVAPCPKGEWKAGIGTSGNCTKCAFGVTTAKEASTSESECKLLLPGYYALALGADGIITKTQICPQKYYCPGGAPLAIFDPTTGVTNPSDPTIKACPNGQWTQDVGAIALEQCLTPPGFYTTGGTTQQCPNGTFRADWKASAASCTSCGDGVQTDKTDRVTAYDRVTNAVSFVSVTTAADDCYIQPGQGLYYSTLTQTWRARNCDSNNYGVNNRTYGLTPAACRDCPTGQVASNTAQYPNSASYFVTNPDGSGGFVSVKACVNLPGYGYNGRVSQKCDLGTYNQGDTYGLCTACPYGMTTSDVGVGITVADCGIAAGFGVVNGTIRPCPIGTYNPVAWTAGNNTVCTACPGFTTTTQEGADNVDSCNLCQAGYGGANCATQCGGVGAGATYGPVGREAGSPCLQCSNSSTGFSYNWMMANDLFQAQPISRPGADKSGDCLSQYQQLVDSAWYLRVENLTNPLYAPGNLFTTASNFADCAAQCTTDCMWATFNYRTNTCYRRIGLMPTYVGADIVAMKNMPSGDVATNAWSQKPVVKGKAVGSGQYTFYRDEHSDEIQGQVPAPGRDNFTVLQDCLDACDNDDKCAGVVIDLTVIVNNRATTCRLIKGDETVGVFLRTVTRSDVTRLGKPDLSY